MKPVIVKLRITLYVCHLPIHNGALFLEDIITDLLLEGRVGGDVSVVALGGVLVGALQDWLLLHRGDLVQLVDATETGFLIGFAAGEVDATAGGVVLDGVLLSAGTAKLKAASSSLEAADRMAFEVGQRAACQGEEYYHL